MQKLGDRHCVACRADAPHATEEETKELMPLIPEWKVIEVDGIKHLERQYKVKNFVEAVALANKVGEIAEAENHHPSILVEWGKVTVTWWTHKIKGLHVNDFVMAAKTDQLV